MTTTQRTGFGLMPLLARLVLGAACFLSGWHLCFQKAAMSTEETRVLEGVAAIPVAYTTEDEDPPADAAAPPETPAPAAAPEATDPAVPAGGTVERAAAERVALSLREAGWGDWSEPAAWAASVLALVGGGMLIIGLLTRFWAFVSAVLTGTSFWLGPIEHLAMFEVDPFTWVAMGEPFEDMMLLAALFVLSVGLLASGGGFWSVDRLLWRRGDATSPVADQPQAEA